MNDLGLSLAWIAVQVSLVLIPAAALHAFAARRGPASGAWAAAAALGIVVGLTLWAILPRWDRGGAPQARIELPSSGAAEGAVNRPGSSVSEPHIGKYDRFGLRLADIQGFLGRLESATIAPLERTGRLGSALAFAVLGGVGLGLIRLSIGICSVALCRSRSRALDDAPLLTLFGELQSSMGIDQPIDIRETSELSTPAAAGWRNPVILLPVDWRTWDLDERRAVLAHELAHVARRDYSVGLMARLASALHFYHPLIHCFASWLMLEQELAADALGARHAGGESLYLQSLSRLALRWNGKSLSLPARAFLPAKGTLIRRIAMLNNENAAVEKPWTTVRKTLAIGFLLAVAALAVSLQGPARGEGDPPASPTVSQPDVVSFDLSYLGNDATCVVALRPAELYRKAGAGALGEKFQKGLEEFYRNAVRERSFGPIDKVDDALRVENIEQVCFRMDVKVAEGHKDYNRSFAVQSVMIRAIEPFDWLKQARAWGFVPEEVREGNVVYYKSKPGSMFGRNAVYLPDDRTIVFDVESNIMKLVGERKKGGPSIGKTGQWERVSHDLFAIAVDNRNGDWTRIFQGTAVEAKALSFVEKVETWVVSLANMDDIQLQAAASCVDPEPAADLARTIETTLQPIRLFAASKDSQENKPAKLAVDLLSKTVVGQSGRTVTVRLKDFGTIADLAARILKENPF